MNDDLDRRLHQLVHEMADAAPSPHAWASVSAAHPDMTGVPRRFAMVAVAAIATLLLAGGIVALAVTWTSPGDDPAPPATQPPERTPSTEPAPTDPPAATDPPTASVTSPPVDTTAPMESLDCREEPERIVEALLDRRVSGGTSDDCIAIEGLVERNPDEPPCWIRCADGRRVVDYEILDDAARWYGAGNGLEGWSLGAWVVYETVDGDVEHWAETWELTYDGDVAPDATDPPDSEPLHLTDITVPDRETRQQLEADAVATVSDYLDAIAAGRYADAARLLDDGAQEWSERDDFARFPTLPAGHEELAEALRSWCESGAICESPTTVSVPRVGHGVEAVASYDVDGEEIEASYAYTFFEGSHHVRGLPPLPNNTG